MEADDYFQRLNDIGHEHSREQSPAPVNQSAAKQRPLLQKIFERYMNPITKLVHKNYISALVSEYQTASGESIVDQLESLSAFCEPFRTHPLAIDPNVEEYSLEQLYDTLGNPGFDSEAKAPVTFQADQGLLRILRSVPRAELKRHSSRVLAGKFQRHLPAVEYLGRSIP